MDKSPKKILPTGQTPKNILPIGQNSKKDTSNWTKLQKIYSQLDKTPKKYIANWIKLQDNLSGQNSKQGSPDRSNSKNYSPMVAMKYLYFIVSCLKTKSVCY
jgi:hypothetical protein